MILTDKLNVSYLPVGNSFRFSVTRSGRYGILLFVETTGPFFRFTEVGCLLTKFGMYYSMARLDN